MTHIHFIAVGGAIMHQLALALQRQGYIVTGSDDEINDPAKTNLLQAGILPEKCGWFPEKIQQGVDAIVLGMHAKADNPELLEAQRMQLPIYSFPEYVYQVAKNKKRVVIAGSHGKTTITSMVMHILQHQGIQFDYLVGAKVAGFAQSVQLSDAPIIIIEGDEYPASVIEKRPKILFYHPDISLISGIAWDHINVFPTYEIYFNQFQQYLEGIEAGKTVFYNTEDTEVQRVIGTSGQHLQCKPYQTPEYTYVNNQAEVRIGDAKSTLSVFGRHNIQNVNAAVSICAELGVAEADSLKAIASFTGAARRLEQISASDHQLVYRDFAHAPSKLRATLNAVREAYADYHLIACFELHTFSSLNEQFLIEYEHSMDAADNSIVFFSHHALELKGLPNLEKNIVKSAFRREDLEVIDDKDILLERIQELATFQGKPIFILLMSSGTFDGIDWLQLSTQK